MGHLFCFFVYLNIVNFIVHVAGHLILLDSFKACQILFRTPLSNFWIILILVTFTVKVFMATHSSLYPWTN